MPAIDQRPTRRPPIVVAAELVRKGDKLSREGGRIIRDLLALSKAQDRLLSCYRLGKQPSDKTLGAIKQLRAATIDVN